MLYSTEIQFRAPIPSFLGISPSHTSWRMPSPWALLQWQSFKRSLEIFCQWLILVTAWSPTIIPGCLVLSGPMALMLPCQAWDRESFGHSGSHRTDGVGPFGVFHLLRSCSGINLCPFPSFSISLLSSYRGVQYFGIPVPYWKKSCLGPHIKYIVTCNHTHTNLIMF